jgi:AcrR family transcriptional regulator
MPAPGPDDSTRTRLLDATSLALAQFGPRKVSLSEIAALAGVSRPTLYRYFASKDDLLLALADHEKHRFESGLAAKLEGLTGEARLDRAMRHVIEFQRGYHMEDLVLTEPAFMVDQLRRALRTMAGSLTPLFQELAVPGEATRPADKADLVVRLALSHFLIRGSEAQLLRELRHAAGLTSTGARPAPANAPRSRPRRRRTGER